MEILLVAVEFRIHGGIIHSIPDRVCHERPTTEIYLTSGLLISDPQWFIHTLTTDGASPGAIRSKVGIVTALRKLTYLHHKLGDADQNEMQEPLDPIKQWKGWMIVLMFADIADMRMERCCFVHSGVTNRQFAHEVLYMDDTSSTNHCGLLLVAIIVNDWETWNQLLA
jgi:hypothetical protein